VKTPRETKDDSRQLALERIALFSDAVMAIAITLLAIEIRLPELHGDISTELPRALMQLWPRRPRRPLQPSLFGRSCQHGGSPECSPVQFACASFCASFV
jgi:hypothetical protein